MERHPLRPDASTEVPSLSRVCIAVVVENYRDTLSNLDPVHHRQHAAALLDAIVKTTGGILPFQTWLQFSQTFGLEMPRKRHTYRGLCIGDEQELGWIKTLNEQGVREWGQLPILAKEVQPPPCFVLATVDLAHDTTFRDEDISKLRVVSPFLSFLRLDYTRVTDDGLAWIVRAAERDDSYRHLQVLGLKGLKKVTNEGVSKLGKLRIRMLGQCNFNRTDLPSLTTLAADLRETACTPEVRLLLNKSTSEAAWRSARFRSELKRAVSLELELFGPSLTPARILAYLHYLALAQSSPSLDIPLVKPICVSLDGITRQLAAPAASDPSTKTAEELYTEQIGLAMQNRKAAFSSEYGAVTSTASISWDSLHESGQAQDKGGAFRTRNDGVASGGYLGVGKTGGRATLFELGRRKLTVVHVNDDDQPLSDSDTEEDREERARRKAMQVQVHNAVQATRLQFYQQLAPSTTTSSRTIVAAAKSELLLLRHLPYQPLCDAPPLSTADTKPIEEVSSPSRLNEGSVLALKKRKLDSTPSSTRSTSSPSDALSLLGILPSARPSVSTKATPTLSKNPFAKPKSRPLPPATKSIVPTKASASPAPPRPQLAGKRASTIVVKPQQPPSSKKPSKPAAKSVAMWLKQG